MKKLKIKKIGYKSDDCLDWNKNKEKQENSMNKIKLHMNLDGLKKN